MERETEGVQRAQLRDIPTALIYEELARRAGETERARFHLTWCACASCQALRAAVIAEGERRDG